MFQKDTICAHDGSLIEVALYAHASVGFFWKGVVIYIDPVGERYGINYADEPKADVILVTHQHADHFDIYVIKTLSTDKTRVYGCKLCEDTSVKLTHIRSYEHIEFGDWSVDTIPAYNISCDYVKFHPKGNEGLGYILTLGGTRIYIAGDTEDNEDVLALKDIDIAFLPVCKPFTMSVEQVLHVVNVIHPKVLYPYHTGCRYGETDLTSLVDAMSDSCELRIRNLK